MRRIHTIVINDGQPLQDGLRFSAENKEEAMRLARNSCLDPLCPHDKVIVEVYRPDLGIFEFLDKDGNYVQKPQNWNVK